MTFLAFSLIIYEYVYIRTSVSGFNEYTRKLIIFKKYREVPRLANIKSAKKRILVAQTKTLRNKMIKSAVKTAIKKVDAAIAANNKELAVAELAKATSAIDKAASKGVYHKNTASRKISRMNLAVNKMA